MSKWTFKGIVAKEQDGPVSFAQWKLLHAQCERLADMVERLRRDIVYEDDYVLCDWVDKELDKCRVKEEEEASTEFEELKSKIWSLEGHLISIREDFERWRRGI